MDTRDSDLSRWQVAQVGAGWIVERGQLGEFEEGGAGRPGVLRLMEAKGGGVLLVDIPIGPV